MHANVVVHKRNFVLADMAFSHELQWRAWGMNGVRVEVKTWSKNEKDEIDRNKEEKEAKQQSWIVMKINVNCYTTTNNNSNKMILIPVTNTIIMPAIV